LIKKVTNKKIEMKIKADIQIKLNDKLFTLKAEMSSENEVNDFADLVSLTIIGKALDIELSERKNLMPPVPPLELYEEEIISTTF
jgi:hypothetical protein